MCMLCNLIPFTEKRPPEGVDLFVCGNPDCTKERIYGIMQYFEKGTHLPDVLCTNAPTRDERLIRTLSHEGRLPHRTGNRVLFHGYCRGR